MRTVPVENLITRLISFDTSDPTRSNKEIVDFIDIYLKKYGIICDRIKNKSGTNENLFATVGPKDQNGIILSGHLDVVPVEGQYWNSSPFEVEIKEDRLYGRGACDMKSFIGCILSTIPDLLHMRVKTPIQIALTCDEETNCEGINNLLDYILKKYPLPKCAIVGEPSNMCVMNSHKGVYGFKTIVKGRSSHASRPDLGINAIFVASKLIAFIELLAKKYTDSNNINMTDTFNIGLIQGGTSSNTVADTCMFEWEYRQKDQESNQIIVKSIQEYIQKTLDYYPGVEINMIPVCCIPPLEKRSNIEIFNKMFGEVSDIQNQAPFATEAGFHQQRGIPAVVCGPGSIEQAHKPDEYVTIEQIEKCEAFLVSIYEKCRSD